MRSGMSFSERFCSGFALAATIAGDPGGEQARTGLQEAAREPVTRVARDLLALSKAERRARVSALAQPPRPARSQGVAWPREARAPLRAYALLAQGEPTATLPAFLRAAPLPRPGFTPEPDMLQLLRRIAFPDAALSDNAATQTASGSAEQHVAQRTSLAERKAASKKPPRKPGTGQGEPWGA